MKPTIHLTLLSSSRIFRDTIASRLITEQGIELLGVAATVKDLFESSFAERADVVVAHAVEGSSDMAEITRRIKRALPSARVVALGRRPDEPDVVRTIEAGARAWLEDSASYAELVDAIRAAAQGRATASLEMLVEIGRRIETLTESKKAREVFSSEFLSKREKDIARLLAMGLANKQIARRLKIKLSTVKKHVHNVLGKLHVERRRDLVGLI